jgi:hypothetical protein
MEPEVLRVREFCVKYAISRTSFYREIAANRLHALKRGRLTFIAQDEAERWFRSLGYIRVRESLEKRYSAALKST